MIASNAFCESAIAQIILISSASSDYSPDYHDMRGIEWSLRALARHASSAFIFASTSSDQICLASSEHFKKYRWRAASTW